MKKNIVVPYTNDSYQQLCDMYELPGSDLPSGRCTEPKFGLCANGEGNPVKMCGSVGMMTMNPYRWSTEACEPFCGQSVCREYGDKLARYFHCKRNNPGCQTCYFPPNPAQNGCRRA